MDPRYRCPRDAEHAVPGAQCCEDRFERCQLRGFLVDEISRDHHALHEATSSCGVHPDLVHREGKGVRALFDRCLDRIGASVAGVALNAEQDLSSGRVGLEHRRELSRVHRIDAINLWLGRIQPHGRTAPCLPGPALPRPVAPGRKLVAAGPWRYEVS